VLVLLGAGPVGSPHLAPLTVPLWLLLQENDEIRCASILLMGNLSKFGSGEPVFKDQIHNVLVSLLLHLVDPKPEVVRVSRGRGFMAGRCHDDSQN